MKVADFGVAKGAHAPGGQKTRSGVIMGTPAYLSPEQARELPVTAASDVYALGVVLYELISGVQPFGGASTLELLSAIVAEPPPPLPEGVPAEVSSLVDAMLAKDPGARPASMGELAAALARLMPEVAADLKAPEPVAVGVGGATRPVGMRSVASGSGTRAVPATPAPAPARVSTVVLACLVTATLCGGAAMAWIARKSEPPAPPAHATPTPAPDEEALRGGRRPYANPRDAMRTRMFTLALAKGPEIDQKLAVLFGEVTDFELANLDCAGLLVNPQSELLCEMWKHLKAREPAEAGHVLARSIALGQAGSLVPRRDLALQYSRALERIACEVFHVGSPRAAELVKALQASTGTNALRFAFEGMGLMVDGSDQFRDAHVLFARCLAEAPASLLPAASGVAVLDAIAQVSSLGDGWEKDPATLNALQESLTRLEAYLDIWHSSDFVPLALELEPALAKAAGRAPRTALIEPPVGARKVLGDRLFGYARRARARLTGEAAPPESAAAPASPSPR